MPFVVMFSDGTYLRKTGHRSVTRERVTDLQKASTWANSGHAKNAIRAAFEHSKTKEWPREMQIVKVKIAKYGQRENFYWAGNLGLIPKRVLRGPNDTKSSGHYDEDRVWINPQSL